MLTTGCAAFAACFGMVLSSCTEGGIAPEAGRVSTMSIVIEGEDVATKAGSDSDARAWETAVSSLDVYLISGDAVARHERFSSVPSLPYEALVMHVPVAEYEVYVLANAPSAAVSVNTKSALEAVAVSLGNCPLDGSGFVMSGSAGRVSVQQGSPTSAGTVAVSRYCSRVRLKSVKNVLPSGYASSGALTVKGVFLENVPTTWTLAGVVNASSVGGWGNLAGRKSGSSASTAASDFIKGASAVNPSAYAAHLAKFPSQGVSVANGATESSAFGWDLYCFPTPNGVAASDQKGPVATTGAVTACPRLVVLATVNGTDYYYPLTLVKSGNKTLERNTCYDVSITIRDTGSLDPNEPVSDGSIYAVVTSPSGTWTSGNPYDEQL